MTFFRYFTIAFIVLYFVSIGANPAIAQVDAQEQDIVMLKRVLGKQVGIEDQVAVTVRYESEAWSAAFIAKYNPSVSDDPWQLTSVEDPTPEQVSYALERIADDQIEDWNLGFEEEEDETYKDMQVTKFADEIIYDLPIVLDIDNSGKEIKNRLRLTINVDAQSELITQTRIYSIRGFRLSPAARVRSMEILSKFGVLPGVDAAILESRSSLVTGRALLFTSWSLDYKAIYSDHELSQ